MNSLKSPLLALVIASAPVVQAQIKTPLEVPVSGVQAELILHGGQIWTPDGWAEAIAIGGGRILAIGNNAEVERLRNNGTAMEQLDGKAVLPGLHDMHVHPLLAGLAKFSCRLEPGGSPESIRSSVQKCVAEAQPGDWIQGGNWVAAVFDEGEQSLAFLDEVSPQNPVFLYDESHHSAWVNSRALQIAGIDQATANPEGGIIERGPDGSPNGLLRESATGLVAAKIPDASLQQKRHAVQLAGQEMLSHGITSFTAAYVTAWHLEAFSGLWREGKMKQRARACLFWSWTPQEATEVSNQIVQSRSDWASERFSTDCVKMMLDGVPTESHTAAMLEPYVATAGNSSSAQDLGMLMVSPERLNATTAELDRQGIHIKFHAAGDAAVRAAIDAVEAARSANGFGGPMHDVAHNSFVSADDIDRVRELGMSWEFSPYIWYPTPIAANDIMRAIGPERMERWIPIRDAVESGGLVAVGSDWPVVPLVNPWLALETMVTRQVPGGSEETLGAGQAVSRETALDILTRGGARMMGHADQVGVLATGMRADFIITDQNPMTVAITDVHKTRVLQTYIDGEKVYDARQPTEVAKP